MEWKMQVSFPLLVFFVGMFITVEGFNRTGLPAEFWNAVEPYARIDRPGGVFILAAVIVLLSNIASNVPTGKVLRGKGSFLACFAMEPSICIRPYLFCCFGPKHQTGVCIKHVSTACISI
jgi:hypothetical protein